MSNSLSEGAYCSYFRACCVGGVSNEEKPAVAGILEERVVNEMRWIAIEDVLEVFGCGGDVLGKFGV